MSYSQTPLARAYSPLSQSLQALCIIHTLSIMSIRMALHYIITSPCFYHYPIISLYNISHNPHFVPILQTRLVSSRAQRRLTLRQSCLPSLARFVRHGRANQRTNQRARLPSPGRIMRMSAPINGLILVRMSTVLLI